MSKEDDDDIVIQGDVGETAQLKEEEKQAKKHDEEEHVEVAEGQELEVIPKNEEEEQQDILLTEATSITPKRAKVAKMKSSVRNQYKEKILADISGQLQKQSTKIDKVVQMLQPLQKYLKSAKKQTELIKELQSHLKQLQKKLSQIKNGIRTTQSKRNKNKK